MFAEAEASRKKHMSPCAIIRNDHRHCSATSVYAAGAATYLPGTNIAMAMNDRNVKLSFTNEEARKTYDYLLERR